MAIGHLLRRRPGYGAGLKGRPRAMCSRCGTRQRQGYCDGMCRTCFREDQALERAHAMQVSIAAKRERQERQERPREPVIRVVDGVEYVVMFDGT
jgi:NMD protein affecting ribosome stability and mRNA decay